MIKSNELRIGNWVNVNEIKYDFNAKPFTQTIVKTTVTKIENIWDEGINLSVFWEGEKEYESFERLEPIPLTPEILEQCGFEKDIIDHPVPNHEAFGFYKFHVKIYWTKQIKVWYKGSPIDIVVKYLHQLQNLYFALTGTELEINLNP